MKKKYAIYIVIIFVINIILSSCENVLEKENLSAINPKDVWNNINLVEAYVNGFYTLMPEMPQFYNETSGIYCDEARPYDAVRTNPFSYGVATIDSYNEWPYDKHIVRRN